LVVHHEPISDVMAARVVVVWEKLVHSLFSYSPLTYPPSISSKWILSVVATAWIASFATFVILFALDSPTVSNGMLNQPTAMLSDNQGSGVCITCSGSPFLFSG
jgi:hypothetical protein